jgi:hypothetical protein
MNTSTPTLHPSLANTHTSDKRTREPVTTSGWYEHTDGTIGHYQWMAGRLVNDATVETWADTK